jgi:hypothetical protein
LLKENAMGNDNLNHCFRVHAKAFGLQEDYLPILAEKNEISKKKIEKLNYEDLVKYSNLVKSDFESYDRNGEVQFKSLVEILTEIPPENEFLKRILENAKYIIELEAFATTTIIKLNNKIDSYYKTLQTDLRVQAKMKLNEINYEGLMYILKSKDNLRDFITK